MKRINTKRWTGILSATFLFTALAAGSLSAADHQEAPGTATDLAADIADVYAWHDTGANTLTMVLTYAGLAAPGGSATYDEDVQYEFNLDTTGDFVANRTIMVRFENDNGTWKMVLENFPGASGTARVDVGSTQTVGSGKAFAGLRDDPFFFDLQGFNETLASGTLSFDGTRDSVAGLNATAIVLEMSLSAALGSSSDVNIWATTGRK